MQNREYWQKRSLIMAERFFNDAEAKKFYLSGLYAESAEKIKADTAVLVARYARDNKLSYAEATQLLTGSEFVKWRKSIEGYISEVAKTGDARTLLELNTLAMRSRISRLDGLLAGVYAESAKVHGEMQGFMKDHLSKVYRDSFYKSSHLLQTGTGVGVKLDAINREVIDQVLDYPWSGANFSQRIWEDSARLSTTLRQTLSDGMIRGASVQDMAKDIDRTMQSGLGNAMRLVRTETAYIAGKGTLDSYMLHDIQSYEYLATLDTRTSEKCQGLDGEIIDTQKAVIGDNYPPTHPNCRSTTVAYFPEDEGEDWARIAKDKEGKRTYVPADMDYEKWYNQFVKEDSFLVPQSVGAMAAKFYVKTEMPLRDAGWFIKEGTYVTGVLEIASGTDIREVERLRNSYPLKNGEKTKAEDWKKVRGTAIITNGIEERAKEELHWYQCIEIGKKEFKRIIKKR